MKLHIPNILFGFSVLFLTAFAGGALLGGTFNAQSIQDGYHSLPLQRFFLREGHSHGNFMAIYNILVGIVLANIALTDRLRKITSWSAMAAVLLPIGLAWKGMLGGVDEPPPVALVGIIGIGISLALIIYGTLRTNR